MVNSRFIKYDGTENQAHRNAKNRLTLMLVRKWWKLVTNTINGEYKLKYDKNLESGYFDYYRDHPKEKVRGYKMDAYMISPKGKAYCFEFDGAYHFKSRRQRNKMVVRDAFIRGYFSRRGITITIMHFTVEELYGKFASDDEYILGEVRKDVDRKT